MSVLRILHGADFHLDSPFEGLPEEKARLRRGEQRELLSRFVSAALAEKVDLVLLSGDLLDSAEIYGETGELLARALSQLSCPVFIAPGNHDYYTAASPYATLLKSGRVHVFRSHEPECVELPELGARVFGAAFTDRISGPLLRSFRAEHYGDTLNLLCIHGEVGRPEGRYNSVTEEELAQSGIDYAAFGHIHQPSGLKKAGSCSYSWPGCPEGRGFDETGDRYVNLIEIDRQTREVRLKPLNIAGRRYFAPVIDITEGDPLLCIHRQLPEDTERDIYRITLTGETETAPELERLRANLEDMFFHLELLDRTTLRRDIWEKAGEDTLRGIFLKKLRNQYDATRDGEQRRLIEQAARAGLAALDNREVPGNDY